MRNPFYENYNTHYSYHKIIRQIKLYHNLAWYLSDSFANTLIIKLN